MKPTNISVYTESTPNPATMKFLVNKLLMNGSVDFATKESAANSPFADELFRFDFVSGVFFANNFVTVTKTENAQWVDIEPILKEFIKTAIESEIKIQEKEEEAITFEGTEVEVKIQQILHDYVRPAARCRDYRPAHPAMFSGVLHDARWRSPCDHSR